MSQSELSTLHHSTLVTLKSILAQSLTLASYHLSHTLSVALTSELRLGLVVPSESLHEIGQLLFVCVDGLCH